MSDTIKTGLPLNQAQKAIIMIHGRGATAESILALVPYLNLSQFAIVAPQAKGNTWYPFGFLSPSEGNLVAVESSLMEIEKIYKEINEAGIASNQIFLIGFSQGACLCLEFAARKAQRFGGVVALTGGLIGDQFQPEKYSGDFLGTPVFIGGSDRDFHVPASRIKESAELLKTMGAEVTVALFDDPDHTIRTEEINWVNQKIFV